MSIGSAPARHGRIVEPLLKLVAGTLGEAFDGLALPFLAVLIGADMVVRSLSVCTETRSPAGVIRAGLFALEQRLAAKPAAVNAYALLAV